MSGSVFASTMSRRELLGSAGCCLALSACGGGGAASSSPAPPSGAAGNQSSDAASSVFTWPAYTAVPAYNFGFTPQPAPALTVRPDRDGVVRRTIKGYVCFSEGPNRDPALTDAMVALELDRLNADLKIAWEKLGFAPDKGFARGYYLNYYLLGSGLAGADAVAASDVGYQGWEFYNGEYWPSLCTSYHAIKKAYDGSFIDRSNITHESIHVLQNGTGNFTKAGWIFEAHNTQLGSRLIDLRDGLKQLGYLDAVSALGPHIPIEAFAGWMVDGTFGNSFPEDGLSPRAFFGGAQYCGTFPLFLDLFVGSTLMNWLWKNNVPDSETVLQTLLRGLGAAQTERAILEYRARVALLDFGAWRPALKAQVDAQFATDTNFMYAATTVNGTTLTPAALTLPGTSGSNYIPLAASGTAASLTFVPQSTDMRCQLVYRATDGSAVYGTPVASGKCSISLSKPPSNGVIVAVITNVSTTHSKTSKFPYTLQLAQGLTPASRSLPYY